MNSLREIFINNLRFYRKEKRYSQEKLSYAIEMGMNYINQIENKASFPPPEIIEKIASVLEIEPFELFKTDMCPQNIEATFQKKFSTSIHTELSLKIQQVIDEVCQKIL